MVNLVKILNIEVFLSSLFFKILFNYSKKRAIKRVLQEASQKSII